MFIIKIKDNTSMDFVIEVKREKVDIIIIFDLKNLTHASINIYNYVK